MEELKGLRALVTGGASGIGLAVAQAFLAEAAQVAVLDRLADRPAEVPNEAVYVCADVTDDAAVRAAVQAAVAQLGGLDVVVNNAGIGAQGAVQDSTDAEWQQVLDVNVIGTARVSRAAWPHLRESAHAAIVNTSSIAATAGLPQRAVYSASKGAVLSLTRAMAADGMADGVRVNAVNPGTADTPWVQRLLQSAPTRPRSAPRLRHGSPMAGWSRPRRSPPRCSISRRRVRPRRPARRSPSTAAWRVCASVRGEPRGRRARASLGSAQAAAAVDGRLSAAAALVLDRRSDRARVPPRDRRLHRRAGRRHA